MMRWAAALFAGEAAGSTQYVEEALRLFPADAGPPSGDLLLALGASRFRLGELESSWAALIAAEERGEPLAAAGARGLPALQAALDGRFEEAQRLADSAEALAGRHGFVEHVHTATLREAQGLVALRTGRPRRAVDLLRDALDLVRRGGLRVEVAEVLTALATAEERLGRAAAAHAHRDEAEHIIATCPNPGFMWADPRIAGRSPTVSPDRNGVALTRRQAEILRLLADALTTVEIGERLSLSPRTVEAHLRTLYRELGVRSRTAAARYAVDHGLTVRNDEP
jgi:DNA-binding CsgD family transcriptional regulator